VTQQKGRHGGVAHRCARHLVDGPRRDLRQFSQPGILQARNYNEEMIVVRYATLVALVIWLGAMVDERFGDVFRRAHLIPYACGAATVVGLFVLKFMGPPPRGFVARAAIAALMLIIAVASSLAANRDTAAMLTTIDIVLGFALLGWYVRE
jgi:hypothetical protein